VTELGIPRNTWVGMAGLDFYKEQADIGTATVVAKLTDGATLTNKTRVGGSRVNYVATSLEGYPFEPEASAIPPSKTCARHSPRSRKVSATRWPPTILLLSSRRIPYRALPSKTHFVQQPYLDGGLANAVN